MALRQEGQRLSRHQWSHHLDRQRRPRYYLLRFCGVHFTICLSLPVLAQYFANGSVIRKRNHRQGWLRRDIRQAQACIQRAWRTGAFGYVLQGHESNHRISQFVSPKSFPSEEVQQPRKWWMASWFERSHTRKVFFSLFQPHLQTLKRHLFKLTKSIPFSSWIFSNHGRWFFGQSYHFTWGLLSSEAHTSKTPSPNSRIDTPWMYLTTMSVHHDFSLWVSLIQTIQGLLLLVCWRYVLLQDQRFTSVFSRLTSLR